MGAFTLSSVRTACKGCAKRWVQAQEDDCQLSDEALHARMVQLRQKLARMEQCVAGIDAAIQRKELEELQSQAAAAHQTADEPMQQLEQLAVGSAPIVLCSETSEAVTPSLPTAVSTDPSLQTVGPLSAQTNVRSGR